MISLSTYVGTRPRPAENVSPKQAQDDIRLEEHQGPSQGNGCIDSYERSMGHLKKKKNPRSPQLSLKV